MKCITFRRWYPGTSRDINSYTYPIETDADKMLLARLIFIERDGAMKDFVCERLEMTYLTVPCADGEGVTIKDILQFFLPSHDYVPGREDEQDKSLIFPIETDVEKIAFANWVIEHKLGEFRQDNTHIFISEVYAPAAAQPVMVPIAVHAGSAEALE